MPTLMEKAALIAKALGIPSSVLESASLCPVVCAAVSLALDVVLDVVRCRFLGAYSEAQGFRHRFLAPNLKMLGRNFLMLRFLNAHDQLYYDTHNDHIYILPYTVAARLVAASESAERKRVVLGSGRGVEGNFDFLPFV